MIFVSKKALIEALEDLSSYDFQKVTWFKKDEDLKPYEIISSYTDDIIAVFDDSGLGDALNTGEVVFGLSADNALRDLDEATNAIDGFHLSEEEILDSPEMAIVREKAAIALQLVKASMSEGGGTIRIVD
jgi:hypothetical protein